MNLAAEEMAHVAVGLPGGVGVGACAGACLVHGIWSLRRTFLGLRP